MIVVTLLVMVIIGALMFIGTFAILTVSPRDVWNAPHEILVTVGELSERSASVHIGLFVTTFVLLLLLALALFVIYILRRRDSKRKEFIEQIITVLFYFLFLVYLGNGIVYVFNVLITFNPSL